jgi:Helix-hairpin-helix motif
MVKIYFLIAALCSFFMVQAQNDKDNNSTDADNEMQILIENLMQDTDQETFDFDTQFEYLENYTDDPINLNTATEKELADFGMLSDIQVQSLLNYRRQFGQIYSVYELLNVPAWDKITVLKTLPYAAIDETKLAEKFNLLRALKYGRNVIFARQQRVVEQQKGFSPLDSGSTAQRYLGSPDRLYLRYRMSYKDKLSINITAEKDAGEQLFKGYNKKGFDFYSAHFYVKDIHKNVDALIIGDYQLYLGQGLAMWSGFGIRKSPAVLNVKRLANPIKPYTSANEALFLRGFASTLQFGKRQQLEITPFISYRGRDANVSLSDTLDEEQQSIEGDEISSLQNFGYHRTDSEMSDRNTIKMLNTGVTTKYRGKFWHIASNTVFNHLSLPLYRGSTPYEHFFFAGQSLLNSSLDYGMNYKGIQFFGETAISSNGGVAAINGILTSLDGKVNVALLHRYYSTRYQTFFGNAFGERVGVNNESGVYLGLETFPVAGLKISGYVDAYKFPWLTSRTALPTDGYEILARADYNTSSKWSLYTQFRHETKGRNASGLLDNEYFNIIVYNSRSSWRLHGNFVASPQFEFRSRVEFSFYKDLNKSKGVVFYQDVIYRPTFAPIKLQARLALFDTDDYDTRIYAYENDVLFSFSVPAYYGRGMRYYFNASYDINRRMTVWLRFAQTYYADRNLISSGLAEIQGAVRSDFRVQIRYDF